MVPSVDSIIVSTSTSTAESEASNGIKVPDLAGVTPAFPLNDAHLKAL